MCEVTSGHSNRDCPSLASEYLYEPEVKHAFLCDILALLLFLALAAMSVWRGADRLDPDGLSYLRLAGYWMQGDWDLAVSGYWSPIFSWIMAALSLLVQDPGLVARLATAVGGLVFFVGSQRLYRASGLHGAGYGIVLTATAVFSATHILLTVAPDLLFSGWLVWAMAHLCALAKSPFKHAFLSGVFFGLAYLSKTPGLPLGLALILAVSGFFALDRAISIRSARNAIMGGLTGLRMGSAPWIGVLSSHYDEFTWSTAAQRHLSGRNLNFDVFHMPREGRITSWEDPTELPGETVVRLAANEQFVESVVEKLGRNLTSTGRNLRAFDVWGLLPVLALVAFVIGGRIAPEARARHWRALGLGVLCIAALYTVTWSARMRYFYACYPFLLVMSVGFLESVFWTMAQHGKKYLAARRRTSRLICVAVMYGLALALLYQPLSMFGIAYSWDADVLPYRAGQHVTSALARIGVTGPMAEVGDTGHVPLYAALHADQPYLGRQYDVDDVDVLFQLGARVVVVESGNSFAEFADSDPRFKNHDASVSLESEKLASRFHVYELKYP
jgi:hypothetical protein